MTRRAHHSSDVRRATSCGAPTRAFSGLSRSVARPKNRNASLWRTLRVSKNSRKRNDA